MWLAKPEGPRPSLDLQHTPLLYCSPMSRWANCYFVRRWWCWLCAWSEGRTCNGSVYSAHFYIGRVRYSERKSKLQAWRLEDSEEGRRHWKNTLQFKYSLAFRTQKDDGLHSIEDEELKKLAMKVIYACHFSVLLDVENNSISFWRVQARNVRPDQRMYDK